jgi:putative Ig domain-containing protein/IPT/TIG domain-containing protein
MGRFTGIQSRILISVIFLLWVTSLALGQSIDYTVSSNPVDVNVLGKAEVLGEVRLVKSDPGVVVTTQGSFISFLYQGVPIVNLFAGRRDISLVTGVISDVGGISIALTGGYVHAGLSAQVRNVVVGNIPNGLLTLALPAGLSVSQGDQIQVSGVEADLTGKQVSTDILCSLQSTPSNANTFSNVSTLVVGRTVDRSPLISTNSLLPDGITGLGYSQTFTATGGTPPYTWSVAAGELPPGLNLIPETGVLQGGPAVAGVFGFTIKVADSVKGSSKRAFTLNLQNISVTGGGMDFGPVPIGASRTRSLIIKNEGGKSATISVVNSGSAAFSLSQQPLVLESGASRPVDLIFTPPDTNQGNFFRALIAFSIPGLTRQVDAIGRGVVAPLPVFTVLPGSGPTIGNTKVKIQGQGFAPGTRVELGGVELADITLVNDQLLVGTTGPHTEGAVEISVAQSDGTTFRTSNAFTYRQFPKAFAGPGAWRIPFVVDSLEFRTNLGINNLNAEAAAVSISLVDNNGLLIAKNSVNVPPNGLKQINNVARWLEGASVVTGREGTLIVESSQEIRAWASQIDNTTSDPSLELAVNQGAAHILIPSVVASEQFTSSVIVINTSSEDGQVNIQARDSTGAFIASQRNLSISGNGYLFFEEGLYAVGGQGPTLFGPVEIEASSGIQVIAAANIRSRLGTGGSFQSVSTDSAASQVSLPYAVDTADFRTNLGINNPGEQTANVAVHLLDKNGLSQGSLSATVPPHGLTQLNNVVRLLSGNSTLTNLQGWLRLESGQPIIAWTAQIDNVTQDANLVVGRVASSDHLLIPSVVSSSDFKSTLVVVNLDTETASVELVARDNDGNVRGSQSATIPALGLLSFPDILDSLGLVGSFGPLEVKRVLSNRASPLLAISRVSSDHGTGGYFEGLPVGP